MIQEAFFCGYTQQVLNRLGVGFHLRLHLAGLALRGLRGGCVRTAHCGLADHRLKQMRLRNVRLKILDVIHICALTVEQGKPKDE